MRAVRIILCLFFALTFAKPLAAQQIPSTPAYPLKVSSNHRYLTDQNGTPFLIVGESPQSLIANLSVSEAAEFFANRASHGFNAVQIHVMCQTGCGGREDYSTRDGITPFESQGDISTPRESYFQRVDAMLRLAAQHGIVVFLTAAETIDSLDLFQENGEAKSRAFGQYLGNRYKNFDNIVWDYGNDFQTWRNPADNAVILAVANGVRDTDSRHLHTVWLDYQVSASRDSPDWAALVDLDLAYTYLVTYDTILREYALFPPMPVYLGEGFYEEENNYRGPLATPKVIRKQEYWAATSGATGSFYGSRWSWGFPEGWQDYYDSPGALQMRHFKNFFQSRAWWKLVPDPSHEVLTAGYGTYDVNADPFYLWHDNDYATVAMASDSSFMTAYLPTIRTVTVNMSKFSAPVIARWYDPTNGTYSTITGSPFSNSGPREFTPTGNNGDGDTDWVLVIESARPHDDFNGDGKSDIVWKHNDGSSAIWLMNGVTGSNGAGLLGPNTGWSIQQVGDFNGDGKSDILWQHTNGSSAIWLMDGLTAVNSGGLQGPGTGWTAQFIGDFNGDGKSDILWQKSDGSSAIWLMDGLNMQTSGGLLGGGTGWTVQSIGDFNGDGKSDVVWKKTDGSSAIWLMNGVSGMDGSGLLGAGSVWSVDHIGDFNGDGKSDILWKNTDGSFAIWLMNGLSGIDGGGSGLLDANTGWSVQHIGDFNGDGRSDVLWQHTDGRMAIWLMNGLSGIDGSGLLGANTGWSVQLVGDSDGDGKSDVLWKNTDGSTAIWLMNGLSVTNFNGLLGTGTGWSLAR